MPLGFRPLGAGPLGSGPMTPDPENIGAIQVAAAFDVDIADELLTPDALRFSMDTIMDAEILGAGTTTLPTRWTPEPPVSGTWSGQPPVAVI